MLLLASRHPCICPSYWHIKGLTTPYAKSLITSTSSMHCVIILQSRTPSSNINKPIYIITPCHITISVRALLVAQKWMAVVQSTISCLLHSLQYREWLPTCTLSLVIVWTWDHSASIVTVACDHSASVVTWLQLSSKNEFPGFNKKVLLYLIADNFEWVPQHSTKQYVCGEVTLLVSCPDPTLSWGKGSGDHWVISWLCRVSSLDT